MNLSTVSVNNWSTKKKIAAILLGILAIVGIIVTIFLVQRQQELRGRAEKSTTLTLTPPNQDVSPGDDAKLDVVINPGINQVNFVKFTIKFNPDKFDPSLTVFNVNPDSPLKPLGDSSFTSYKEEGEVTFTLSVGSDATKVVRETVKLGTILLPTRDDAGAGAEQISFNENETQVRSTLGTDAFTENVLSSTTPATVTIVGVCRPNIGTCSWDPSKNATTYRFKILNVNDDTVVAEGETSETKVEFPTVPGKTYRCEVIAANVCAEASPSDDQATCPVPSATPTPAPSGTPTPSPSASPTPTPSSTPTPTTPGTTNTPTPTSVNTPTPTTPQGGVETPTPTDTPVPTLPPTGNPLVLSGIVGGILFILGGIVLLFL